MAWYAKSQLIMNRARWDKAGLEFPESSYLD